MSAGTDAMTMPSLSLDAGGSLVVPLLGMEHARKAVATLHPPRPELAPLLERMARGD